MEEYLGVIIGTSMFNCMFGAICAYIAVNKGHSGFAWFCWGFIFGLLACIVILFKKDKNPKCSNNQPGHIKALDEYKRLLEEGVITQEEYMQKAFELLLYPPPESYALQSYDYTKKSGPKWTCPECGHINPHDVWFCESCDREK